MMIRQTQTGYILIVLLLYQLIVKDGSQFIYLRGSKSVSATILRLFLMHRAVLVLPSVLFMMAATFHVYRSIFLMCRQLILSTYITR